MRKEQSKNWITKSFSSFIPRKHFETFI